MTTFSTGLERKWTIPSFPEPQRAPREQPQWTKMYEKWPGTTPHGFSPVHLLYLQCNQVGPQSVFISEQECIPVGYVPTAEWPYLGGICPLNADPTLHEQYPLQANPLQRQILPPKANPLPPKADPLRRQTPCEQNDRQTVKTLTSPVLCMRSVINTPSRCTNPG